MELLNNRYRNAYNEFGIKVADDADDATWATYQDYLDYTPDATKEGGASYDEILDSVKNTAGTLNTVTNSLKNLFGMIKGDTQTPTYNPYQINPGIQAPAKNYTPFIIAGVVGVGLIILLFMTKPKTITTVTSN